MFVGNSCSCRYSENVTRRFVPDNITHHRGGALLILHTHTSRATSHHLLQLFLCKNSKSRIIELTEHPDAVHHICRLATTPDLFTSSPRCEEALSCYGPVFHDSKHTCDGVDIASFNSEHCTLCLPTRGTQNPVDLQTIPLENMLTSSIS